LGDGFEPYAVADPSVLLTEANESFEGGFPSTFADSHYLLPTVTAPVLEPSTYGLLVAGFAAIGLAARRRRG